MRREQPASRMHAWALSSILMLGGLFIQIPPPPSAASFDGTVFNKLTGAPVKNAHVLYIQVAPRGGDAAQPISTDTDASGRFAIQIEAGSYRLWVERPGYARQTYGSRTPEGPGSVLTLAAGQQLHDVEIKLTPLGAIAGGVFDDDGDPLQGVGIQILRFSYSTGRQQLIPVAGASSNDRGEYRAYDLPAGRYLLLATPRGAPLSRPMETASLIPQAQEPFAPLYYPGVLDAAGASEVALAAGAEMTGIDFRLPKVRAVTIRGRLVSPIESFAGSQIQVVLAHSDGNTASYINRASGAFDAASGRFEFRAVAPGSYWLAASQIYHGRAWSGRIPVEVSAASPPENLTVSLTSTFELEGHVDVETSTTSLTKLAQLTVRMVAADGLAPGPPPSSKVGADGSFRLSGVTSGVWAFILDPMPEGLWLKAATYGESDVLQGQLNITSGPTGVLHIVLASNGAQVSGTVSGAGEPGRRIVVLAPAAEELRRSAPMYRTVSTQDHGVFVFKDVRPGTYKLFAFEDVEPFAWLDAEVMKPLESLGETVSVAEGERVERQLVTIPAENLLPGH
jgi:Carboxypeptidase regulatory-like domain